MLKRFVAAALFCLSLSFYGHAETSCPDQAAALLAKVDPLIADFKEQARTALSTSRMVSAPEIGKLRAILRETLELQEWPDASCQIRLREKLEVAEKFGIERLERFRDGSKESGARHAQELWDDADRQLRALRKLVERRGGVEASSGGQGKGRASARYCGGPARGRNFDSEGTTRGPTQSRYGLAIDRFENAPNRKRSSVNRVATSTARGAASAAGCEPSISGKCVVVQRVTRRVR